VSLALFGSAVSRLHSRGSDVDVSLLVQRGTKFRPADDAPPGDHAAARRRLLGALTRELQRVPLRIDDVLFLPHARVPLVKFVDRRSGTACDVCVANDGVFKSGVLGLLAARQPLFQALVRLVKAWAKGAGINDPAAGTLNSFALALMCAFHCQTGVNPPLLPPLAALLCDAPEVALAEEAARAAAGDIKAGPLRREIDAGRDFAAAERRAAALPDAAFGSGAAPPSLAALTASFFAHWAAALPSLAAGAVPRPFAAAWGTGGAWGAAKAYSMAVEDAFDASENPARSLYRGAQFERVASAVRGAAQALAVPPAGPGALRALAEALFGDETAFEEGTDAELRVPPRGPLVVSPAPGRGRGRGRGAGRGAGGRGARRDRGGGREGMPPQAPPPPPQQQQTMMPPPPPLFSAAPTRGIYSAVPPPPPGPAPPAGGRRIPAPRPMPVAQAAAPDGGAPVTAAPPRRQRAPRADADGAAPAVPRRPRQRSAGRNAGQPGDAPPAA
jgi:poly(A) RNA polymerase